MARHTLSSSRFDLRATTYTKDLAGQHRRSLLASAAAVLARVTSADESLTAANKTASEMGLDIGTLQSCLGGVQGAYKQIAAGNPTLATDDMAAVSAACLSLESTSSDGVVYPFDFPDPFVLRAGSTYFAYGTNSAEGNIQIIESTNLSQWSVVGNALPNLPSWAKSGGTWAPSVLQIGGTYVLYFAAVVAGSTNDEECVSAATASEPQGPFVDDSSSPFVCQTALSGSIDPSPFLDANGTPYLEWKSNGGAGQPATIWSEQLNASGTGFAGIAPTQLLTADQSWQARIVEAPDLVLSGGNYFLFYSGNNWDSASYAIGVATCSGPLGPCTEPSLEPILASGAGVSGPGGQSIFSAVDGSLWVAFDGWESGAVGYPHSRVLFVRPLSLSGAIPVIGTAG